MFTTAFILLETIFYSVESARDQSIVTTLQLVTIVIAFAVDWLPYTLFGFWLLSAGVAWKAALPRAEGQLDRACA